MIGLLNTWPDRPPANPAIRRTRRTRQSGNPAIRQSGNPAIRQSGNPASILNQHDYAYKNKSVYARLKIGIDDLISGGTHDVRAGFFPG
jgi:hypothetical protein